MPPFKFSVTLWAFLLMFSIYMSLQNLICSIKLKIPLKSILLLINLTLFMLGRATFHVLLLSADFFFQKKFQTILSDTLSECQMVWIQISANCLQMLSG